jgi:hypothetical protein
MTLDFAMRDFESFFDVFYDVRAGSPDGPIVFSGGDVLQTSVPVPWGFEPPEGAVVIPGATDGFYPGGIGGSAFGFDQEGLFTRYRVQAAVVVVPEPAAVALCAIGLTAIGVGLRGRR